MIKLLIFCVEYMLWYMLVPGRIENNNIIVDLKGLGITQLPISALSDIYKVMSHHYIGRVFRFYVVNLSPMLNMISGAVTGLLTDRQKQKLCILSNVKDLGNYFALHQLEEDLGGTAPIIKDFFPFPMPAGPFEIGASSGANSNAVSGCHRALSEAGKIGHLWDLSKSVEQNGNTDWSAEAYDIFERCNYPIPSNCARPKPTEELESNGTAPKEMTTLSGSLEYAPKLPRASLKELGIATCDLKEPAEADDTVQEPAKKAELPLDEKTTGVPEEPDNDERSEVHNSELQDETVQPTSGWFCRSCTVGPKKG